MSKFIREYYTAHHDHEQITLIIQTEDGKFHYVDGNFIPYPLRILPAPYEVMSFPFNPVTDMVDSWSGEFRKGYDTWEQLMADMCVMIEGLEYFLEREEV